MVTICIATSLLILNKLHAIGTNGSAPPGMPEAPHAPITAIITSKKAVMKSTWMPNVCTAASVRIVMVIDAPSIFMVAPSGMVTA